MRLADILPDLTPLRTSRDFRAVFGSRTAAYLGTQAAEVALVVQAKQLTNSPFVVGTLGLAELVPLLVFGLFAGALADRLDRRKVIVWCEPGLAACAILLLVNALLPHPLLWPLYVIAAAMMSLSALQRPSFEAAIQRLVPPQQQTASAALLSISMNAVVLAGSSLGGVLAITPGPYSVYALDAAGFLVSFALLTRLPAMPRRAPGAGGTGGVAGDGGDAGSGGGARAIAADILVGLRYAVGRKELLGSYVADLIAMIFAYPNALLPFMAVLVHAPWAAGLLFAAPSAGALLMSLTSGWMRRVRRHGLAITVSAGCWGLAMAGLGLSSGIGVALLMLAIAGGADEASGIFRDVLWNQTIPNEIRGRMAGIEMLSYAAGPPTGQLRSGAVAAVAGIRFSLVTGGLACVAGVAVACAALPAFRRYRAAPGYRGVTAPGATTAPGAPPGDGTTLEDGGALAAQEALHEAERA
ncbi:MAG TPA: MFS transporter [Trebonia sp.]|nr:MFS transporter [Trebonia sp.]